MLLINMFLILNFLLVVSLFQPFRDTSKYPLKVTKRNLRGYESSTSNNLLMRRVACLGKNGEIVETVCCTDSQPKPWIVLLPVVYMKRCFKSDCFDVCYLAILNFSKGKYISKSNTEEENTAEENYDEKNDNVYEKSTASVTDYRQEEVPNDLNYEQEKELSNSVMVAFPEIILELLDLCTYINNTNLAKFKKLNSLCKLKYMNLNNFLTHLNYYTNKNNNPESDDGCISSTLCMNEQKAKIPKYEDDEKDLEELNYLYKIDKTKYNNSQGYGRHLQTAFQMRTVRNLESQYETNLSYTKKTLLEEELTTKNTSRGCCCECNTKREFNCVEKVKKVLNLLLKRPRPTFVHQGQCVTHNVTTLGNKIQ